METAEKETGTFTLFDESAFDLPPAQYSFLEMFCDEPGCDCRRVLFAVASSLEKDVQAVIAWGWEDRNYYVEWAGDDDPKIIDEFMGPVLNRESPQSENAPALLKLFKEVLLDDSNFIEKVKRHYDMFRTGVENRAKAEREAKRLMKQKRARGKG